MLHYCVRDKLDAYIIFEILIYNMCNLFIYLLLGGVFGTIHLHIFFAFNIRCGSSLIEEGVH
jgi:hypothetical protein